MATPTLSLMQPSLDVGPSRLGDVDHDATRPSVAFLSESAPIEGGLGRS